MEEKGVGESKLVRSDGHFFPGRLHSRHHAYQNLISDKVETIRISWHASAPMGPVKTHNYEFSG